MDLLVGTGVVTALEIVQEIVPGLGSQSCFFSHTKPRELPHRSS